MSKHMRLSEDEYRALLKRNPSYAKLLAQTPLAPTVKVNPNRKSKYNAQRTTVDGITFASKKEAKRYQELRLMEKAGEITCLAMQIGWPLAVNGVDICIYVCDFEYTDKDNKTVVEDVKGMKTPIYRLKKKLMLAIHGITVRET